MAKKTLEEMLNDSSSKPSARPAPEKKRGRRRQFTEQEKRRLAIYWTILILCLAGFIIMLIFLIGNNPLEQTRSQISMPSCTYVVSQTVPADSWLSQVS